MSSTLYCYICDVETLKRKSVFGIRTRHSRLPIAELLKKIQNSDIRPRDGSNICVLCDDCVDEINIYDEACQLAERVEKQLKETLVRTEKRYENGTDPIKIFETEQMEVSRDSKEAALNLNCVAADQFDLDEMNGVSLDLDDNNDTCSANMSEPENEVESEEEDFDSDDSFVWPKSSALKRKREKEKGKENVKKKQHIFKCIDCPAEYRDKYEMQLHVASHKTNFQVRCGICYMRITRGRESMEHENYHLNRLDLQCIFCDEIFEKKGDLVFHVETHNGDIQTICYICGTKLRTKTMDSRHIKAHLGIKDFKCTYCPSTFVDGQHLNRHLRTHTGEKPYVCTFEGCTKRFSSYTNRKEHSFIHTDKRPAYFRECTICGKLFRRAGLLAEHYKKCHDSLTPVASTSK